jgi:DNA primase
MDNSRGDLKFRVLEATEIVELIGRTVKLQRRGKEHVGLCPFHQEKTPSFHVSQSKQFFFCYGCKKHGNAIDFLIERDRIEFKDALRQLAEAANIPVPEYSGGPGGGSSGAGETQLLRDAHAAATMLFEKQLAHPTAGQAARDYLAGRGFNTESIKRFRIGLAGNSWDALLTSPLMKKFTPGQLALAGLVKPRENGGGFYDTFRDRLIFPIRDTDGRTIAFGGRVMPGSDDKAKYLNSPQTPLFDKGRCAFGLDLAKDSVVQGRTVAVVEGYTDVVMAHQFGCANVVSVLGTSLTSRHVSLLGRYADRIVLLFDPDSAGDSAVDRAVELFLTQDRLDICVAQLPDGLDPDEFLIQRGAEAFIAVLSESTDALTYKWRQLVRRFAQSADNLTGQQKAVDEYLALLASARQTGPIDPLRWGSAVNRVSRLTQIPAAELHRRFKARTSRRPPAAHVPTAAKPNTQIRPSAQDTVEADILGYLLCEPGHWAEVQKYCEPPDFTPGPRRALAEAYWRHQQDEGEPILNQFLDLLEPAVKETAAELAHRAMTRPDARASLESALKYLQSQRQRVVRQECEARLRGGDPEEERLLQQLESSSRIPDPRRFAVPYGA